ncbi:MAG: sodium:solute symporter [Spirochaetia bacterium]|nr:sodium:solute symporter [Spirochaetia bacterium]
MSILFVSVLMLSYFLLLLTVSRLVSRKESSNEAYFRGNRRSPWIAVAYGMIGTLLSGVTFMSVPGYVRQSQFTYLGVVAGNFIGFFIIAFILLPLYYRLNLTSIYSYLGNRFGVRTQTTGAFLFMLSRLIGSALRLYIVVFVLYEAAFKKSGLPFWVLAAIILFLILLYTFRGGIKTVVWTDVLQTTCMLLAIAGILYVLKTGLGSTFSAAFKKAGEAGMMRIFDSDWRSATFFWKQIASGICISITMTGLDQDMMQKNLSCRSLRESQKNMSFTATLFVLINVLFLGLGILLLSYAENNHIVLPQKSDAIFSTIALSAGPVSAVLFMLGLVAAGYSSADGTIAALTTSFCVDVIGFEKRSDLSEEKKVRLRKIMHVVFTTCFFIIIVGFRPFHSDSLISTIFVIAGYTYGPLLALFCFGMMLKKRRVFDKAVPFIAVISPVASYLINRYSKELLFGYTFGFEILLLNALLAFAGLLLFSRKED